MAEIRDRFDQELLDRHRPLLRFDPQYDHRLLAIESVLDNPDNLLRRSDGEVIARAGGQPALGVEVLSAYPGGLGQRSDDCLCMAPDYLGDSRRMEWEERHRGRIYGRVVEDGDRTWLQYWFWLYYNPKNLLGFGKHEGDWEMMQVGLGSNGQPEVATYAQHNSGEARRWTESEMQFVPGDPARPVVYIAPLSHASYFEAGTHPIAVGFDHPFENGPPADLPVVEMGPWKDWQGHWGNSERVIARKIGDGPPSPGCQGQKWTSPAAWHRRMGYRRVRVALGRLVHWLGRLTFPSAPRIEPGALERDRLAVSWELGKRSGRHLYLTVHERHFVIASHVVQDAGSTGSTTILLPESRPPTAIMASSYNRLRQRSDVTTVPVSA